MTIIPITKWHLGQRVRFKLDSMAGTIVETGYNTIKIRWDDGGLSIFEPDMYHAIESVKK